VIPDTTVVNRVADLSRQAWVVHGAGQQTKDRKGGAGMPEEHESDLHTEGHFEDKTRRCQGCNLDIFIPHNQVGGFWHLSGRENKHGRKFWGGYCSSCFSKLDNDSSPKEEK
jgi:hypothetical protein